MLFALSGTASAQQFDSFRFVSEISPAIAGSVTGIEFFESASGDNDADNPKAALSFLDASGLSTVFDVSSSHPLESLETVFRYLCPGQHSVIQTLLH